MDAITLRPFDVSDVDDFMAWVSDERVTRFCTFDAYTSKEDCNNFINKTVMHHPWFRAICINNRPIGSICVTPSSDKGRERTAELAYVLDFRYWGKGIATQAVKMVTSTIFADWPHLERLEAMVIAENGGSQRVLEKAGFRREGVLRKYVFVKGRSRDLVMFSLLSNGDHIMS